MIRTLLFSMVAILAVFAVQGQETDKRFIREDRIWEYYKTQNSYDSEVWERYRALLSYRFDGTERVYGEEYHKCMLFKATLWKEIYDENQEAYVVVEPVTTVELNECVGLLREDGSKVYIFSDSETLQTCSMPYDTIWNAPYPSFTDPVLFDFSVEKGDIFYPYLMSTKAGPMLAESYVKDSGIDSEGRNRYIITNVGFEEQFYSWETISKFKISIYANCMQCIGNYGNGEMLRFGDIVDFGFDAPERVMGKAPADWQQMMIDDYVRLCGFNNYYDLEGNVLFEGAGIKAPGSASIRALTDKESIDGTKVYDLLGREVKEAVPGSIYIKGGNKFVAK